MSVAVQKMVDAAAAGVAMTLDPINGDRTKIVIDSAFGLGEPVVSGEITPDNFVVEKVLLEIIRRHIVEKDHELVADRVARRTIDRVIEPERRTQPSLSDQDIIAVARLAKQLEKYMGGPQDVEWAIDRDLPAGDNLVALQSRPETVWSRQIESDTAKDLCDGDRGCPRNPALAVESETMTSPVKAIVEDKPMTLHTRFPSPYDLKAPAGADGWEHLYPYYLLLPGQTEGQGRGQVLVLRQPALAQSVQAVRRRDRRVRRQMPRPIQHAPLFDAASERRRLPYPQRLRLHEPGRGGA